MKNTKYIPLLILAFLVTVTFAHSQEQPLRLTMKSDRNKYKVGEEIILQCTVKNISDKIIAFHSYNQKNIGLLNANGEHCIREPLQTGENSEPLVTLQPGESLNYTLKGKILKRKGAIPYKNEEGILRGYSKGNYKEVFGIFIEFQYEHYYLQENYGEYKIISHFQDGNSLEIDRFINLTPEKRNEFLKNKWQGELVSNPITIEIIK